MSRTYLITDRAEVDRRRRHLSGTIVEVWPDLYAGDVAWLGDPATRRVSAGQARAAPPGGRCWLSEDSKAGLDALGAPLPFAVCADPGFPAAQPREYPSLLGFSHFPTARSGSVLAVAKVVEVPVAVGSSRLRGWKPPSGPR